MDIRARKAALRAAFKIAFASSLLGCGGDVIVTSPPDQPGASDPLPEQPPDTSPPTTATVAPPKPPPPPPPPTSEACVEPAGSWQVYEEPAFACCVDFIGDEIARRGPINSFDDLGESANEIFQCCIQITEPNLEQLWQGAPLPFPAPQGVIESCCNVRNGNPSCTPWGPPTPPAMVADDDLGWLDAAMEGVA